MVELTKEDMLDVQTVGRVGKNLYPFNKLWYALKDKIIEKYGTFKGYVEQEWSDPPDDFHDFEGAVHRHILKEYWLSSGNIDNGDEFIIIHTPTNEYYYWNFDYPSEDTSENYKELHLQIIKFTNGKKNYSWNNSDKEIAWKALKRLVGKFGYLLKCYKQKELPFPEEEQIIPF